MMPSMKFMVVLFLVANFSPVISIGGTNVVRDYKDGAHDDEPIHEEHDEEAFATDSELSEKEMKEHGIGAFDEAEVQRLQEQANAVEGVGSTEFFTRGSIVAINEASAADERAGKEWWDDPGAQRFMKYGLRALTHYHANGTFVTKDLTKSIWRAGVSRFGWEPGQQDYCDQLPQTLDTHVVFGCKSLFYPHEENTCDYGGEDFHFFEMFSKSLVAMNAKLISAFQMKLTNYVKLDFKSEIPQSISASPLHEKQSKKVAYVKMAASALLPILGALISVTAMWGNTKAERKAKNNEYVQDQLNREEGANLFRSSGVTEETEMIIWVCGLVFVGVLLMVIYLFKSAWVNFKTRQVEYLDYLLSSYDMAWDRIDVYISVFGMVLFGASFSQGVMIFVHLQRDDSYKKSDSLKTDAYVLMKQSTAVGVILSLVKFLETVVTHRAADWQRVANMHMIGQIRNDMAHDLFGEKLGLGAYGRGPSSRWEEPDHIERLLRIVVRAMYKHETHSKRWRYKHVGQDIIEWSNLPKMEKTLRALRKRHWFVRNDGLQDPDPDEERRLRAFNIYLRSAIDDSVAGYMCYSWHVASRVECSMEYLASVMMVLTTSAVAINLEADAVQARASLGNPFCTLVGVGAADNGDVYGSNCIEHTIKPRQTCTMWCYPRKPGGEEISLTCTPAGFMTWDNQTGKYEVPNFFDCTNATTAAQQKVRSTLVTQEEDEIRTDAPAETKSNKQQFPPNGFEETPQAQPPRLQPTLQPLEPLNVAQR